MCSAAGRTVRLRKSYTDPIYCAILLTGTNIPPSIAIIVCVLDCLLAAEQGVRNYGLELGQTLHLIQDAAAIQACGELCQEYLKQRGFDDAFTPVTSLRWMGAWPQDDAQCAARRLIPGLVKSVLRVAALSLHHGAGHAFAIGRR